MLYALLVYGSTEVQELTPEEERGRVRGRVREALARPDVPGWLSLQQVDAATTVRLDRGRTLLSDGPFVDSKDYLGGFVVVEADNLDGAIAIAEELQTLRGGAGAIEIRPVLEGELGGA